MNHDYSNKSFIDGSTLWQDDIRAGLHKVQLQNGNWELYENTPCSLYDSLVNSKNHFPDKCCIVDDNGATYTYQQFFELVEEFSRVLYTQYYVVPVLVSDFLCITVSNFVLLSTRLISCVPLLSRFLQNIGKQKFFL